MKEPWGVDGSAEEGNGDNKDTLKVPSGHKDSDTGALEQGDCKGEMWRGAGDNRDMMSVGQIKIKRRQTPIRLMSCAVGVEREMHQQGAREGDLISLGDGSITSGEGEEGEGGGNEKKNNKKNKSKKKYVYPHYCGNDNTNNHLHHLPYLKPVKKSVLELKGTETFVDTPLQRENSPVGYPGRDCVTAGREEDGEAGDPESRMGTGISFKQSRMGLLGLFVILIGTGVLLVSLLTTCWYMHEVRTTIGGATNSSSSAPLSPFVPSSTSLSFPFAAPPLSLIVAFPRAPGNYFYGLWDVKYKHPTTSHWRSFSISRDCTLQYIPDDRRNTTAVSVNLFSDGEQCDEFNVLRVFVCISFALLVIGFILWFYFVFTSPPTTSTNAVHEDQESNSTTPPGKKSRMSRVVCLLAIFLSLLATTLNVVGMGLYVGLIHSLRSTWNSLEQSSELLVVYQDYGYSFWTLVVSVVCSCLATLLCVGNYLARHKKWMQWNWCCSSGLASSSSLSPSQGAEDTPSYQK
eukprot:Nk52_evm76s208 gene=Nk52_evmTU76s208